MRKALRRSLENKGGTPTIIFLSDEQSNPPAGGYACFSKEANSEAYKINQK